jgi:hypothetical protein
MVIYAFQFEYDALLEKTGSNRAVDRAAKAAHELVAKYWHEKILPRHFTVEARTKYKHKPRSEEWKKRKKRLAKVGKVKRGGIIDLIATGATHQSLTEYADIRAYPTRFSVTMHGPDYIGMRPMNPKMPNMGAEVTRVTPDEQDEMDDLVQRHLPRLLEQAKGRRGPKRVTIK